MKYNYPYKEWLGGVIFFLLISLYGVFLIYDVQGSGLFLIGYIALCYILFDWYWSKLQLYKSKYIKIDQNFIEFSFNNKQVVKKYTYEEIQYIFNTNHKQRLKTHNVVHFFMENGDYYYLTNDVNNYEKLKKDLQKNFSRKYLVIEELFHGVLEGDKKKLFLEKVNNIDKSA